MTATAISAAPPRKPAHRDANVLRWLTAYAASMLGDTVYFLALGFATAKVAAPTEVGMVLAVGAVPRAVLMLGGGVVADRFGPRRVVIGSDAVRCVLILGVAAALALTAPGLWLLIAVALVFGVVDALFMPAVGALPPRIVAPDQLVRLQGMRALVIRFGNIVGPPVDGLAMGLRRGDRRVHGGRGALRALRTVAGGHPLRPAARGCGGRGRVRRRGRSAWRELVDGLRYIRGHRLVGPLVVSGAICELGLVGPLNVGMILLADDRGWGSAGYGWIVGAFGAGAAVSALLLTVRGRLPRAGKVQIGTLFASSATLGLIGVAPSLAVATAMGVLAGLPRRGVRLAGLRPHPDRDRPALSGPGQLGDGPDRLRPRPARLPGLRRGRRRLGPGPRSSWRAPPSACSAVSSAWSPRPSAAPNSRARPARDRSVRHPGPRPRPRPRSARARGPRSPASPRTPSPPRPRRRRPPPSPRPGGRRRRRSARWARRSR